MENNKGIILSVYKIYEIFIYIYITNPRAHIFYKDKIE